MADPHIDIAHMVMETRYKMQLESEASSVKGGQLSDMEREQYQNQIKELVRGMQTLLDANKAMGERMAHLEKIAKDYEDLKAENAKLKGELAMRKRGQHGKKSEKLKDTSESESDSASDGSKDEDEDDYIENGSNNQVPPAEDDGEEEASASEPPVKKERDLSNRPDHYNTMHADICVIHDCDLNRLSDFGLEFIRYTRPVDQFDRVSLTRQDRYRYVWVRDKEGNEFSFFVPKSSEEEKRECVFVNESKYDVPCLVPHTSATYSMLSDLGVNRFQYALSSGREMYRMSNEKMCMSQQSILNWLARGAELLEGGKKYIKKKLLKMDTSIYCDETWVWTKVRMADGSFKYVKRYMWVIVNLTTKVCYYLFGRRRRKVIEEFLAEFKGTLMTDAYSAYAYFSKLHGCTHACCWAHVRRIFWSAFKDYKDILAQEFIDLIGILYKVELECILLHRTESEVLAARKLESVPILNELDQKAMALLAKIKSKAVKVSGKLEHALNYMRNNWKELIAYINVGSVLIDNNCCERAVRPFTNLRKSFGGFSSEMGGEVAAAWLTFIETCKLQKKAALDFFNGFFRMVTEGRNDYELIAQEALS